MTDALILAAMFSVGTCFGILITGIMFAASRGDAQLRAPFRDREG